MPRAKSGKVSDDYLALINQFPLVSIESDQQLDEAIAVLDSLLSREPLTDGEEQYLGALTDLVEHYEAQHIKFDAASDGAMLQHLIDSKGVSQSEVAKATGIQKSLISEVLKDKRKLSRANVQKVCRYFDVSTSLFADIAR